VPAPAAASGEGGPTVRMEDPEPADRAVAATYDRWPDKGPPRDGWRLTLMSDRMTYAPGEEVRVIHVAEAVQPGFAVYVMGPKPVRGEEVDGRPATPPVADDDDPFVPSNYDGVTLESPAVDTNYAVTVYAFPGGGDHDIRWRLRAVASNILRIHVRD